MITQTIKSAIMEDSDIIPGFVYVVRDGDNIFYVGQSKDPYDRLPQHLGLLDRYGNFDYPRKKFIQTLERGHPSPFRF